MDRRDGITPGDEEPLLDPDDGLPSADERLRFIARAVQSYGSFDAALSPFRELVQRLLEDRG